MFDGGKGKPSSSLKLETERVSYDIWKSERISLASRDFETQTSLQLSVIMWSQSLLLGFHVSCRWVAFVPPISSCHCLPCHSWISNPLTNSPDAQSSSSAPFSQSFSPSHLHDNDTHLLVDPPQSNFSGGHVCMPVGQHKREYKQCF